MFRRFFLLPSLAIVVVGATYCFIRRPSVILPPEKEYPPLPVQFRDALRRERTEVRANGSVAAIEELGRLYQANRLFSEAVLVYNNLGTRLSPEDHYDLALLLLEQGDLPQAARELESVLAASPTYIRAEATLAEIYFKVGNTSEAEAVYQKMVSADPYQPEANLGLARIELQKGKDDQAAARLEKLLAKHPEQTGGIALLSQLWARRGNTERAEALAKWSRQRPAPIADDPWREHLLLSCYDIQTLSLEFENYANTGQLAKALPLLDRVESLDPHNWIPDLLRGWSQAQAHHLDEAITSYRKALDKNGDKEKLIPLLASALREKGAKAEALKICAKASAELPDSMPILVAYEAIVAEGNDRKTDALLLKRMLEKEPFTYSTHLKLSKLYWEAGQQDEALPYLKQIAELYPADVTSRALLAEYYVSKDQPSLAIPLLEQALQRVENTDPARPQLRSSLANAYLKNAIALSSGAKYEEAGEAAEKASELLPTDLPALSVAVENFAQAKNFRRAEAGLQKLIRLQPDNPTLYLSLGDVEAQQGRTAEAREHWQMALERVPAADTELRPELQSRLNPPDSAVK